MLARVVKKFLRVLSHKTLTTIAPLKDTDFKHMLDAFSKILTLSLEPEDSKILTLWSQRIQKY